MIEFTPRCFDRPLVDVGLQRTHELQNFSLVRDAQDQLIGLAISEAEVYGPVLRVCMDRLNQKLWLQTKDEAFFIPQAELPEDVVDAIVKSSSALESLLKVYSLPVDDNAPPEENSP